MEKAVSVLYRTYSAICAALSHQAAKGDCSAKELNIDIIQYKFIAITHLMMDILPYLARVSKVIQNVNIDFSKVKPMVDSTCESLNHLIECGGVFVDKLSCAVVAKEWDRDIQKPNLRLFCNKSELQISRSNRNY